MTGEPLSPTDRIREAASKKGWTETELAWALGYSEAGLTRLLTERPLITPKVAVRLEAAFDIPAETWMDAQRDVDLARVREDMGGELAGIRHRATLQVPDLP